MNATSGICPSLGAGTCTAYFDLECQEKSTRAAFLSKRDSDEFIEYNHNLYKLILDEQATAKCFAPGSKWFPPATAEGEDTDGYYMIGGNFTPIVGGEAKTPTRGWVMQAFVGRAQTTCEPYRGAPSVCSTNRVCSCQSATDFIERRVSNEDQ